MGEPAGSRKAVRRRVQVRRVYDEPGTEDGVRVLVDRLWPRGLRKAEANLDEWVSDVAPSTELRTWYGHDPEKFTQFRSRYRGELDAPARDAALEHLRTLSEDNGVTLLTATRDVARSNAAVLADVLRETP